MEFQILPCMLPIGSRSNNGCLIMFHCAIVMGFLLAFIIISKLWILNEILVKGLETINNRCAYSCLCDYLTTLYGKMSPKFEF